MLVINPERMIAGRIHVYLTRNRRAKRYIVRVVNEQTVYVTVPRGGNRQEALAFLEQHRPWVEERLEAMLRRSVEAQSRWKLGSKIWYRGRKEQILPGGVGTGATVKIGGLSVSVPSVAGDLRSEIEATMWEVAKRNLPPLVERLAAEMSLMPQRTTVRNQRTRWGSCSQRGAISLNWRLIQIPLEVCEYVVTHELCHLWHMNHSHRFWAVVSEFCPEYRTHEAWLKAHTHIIVGHQA